MIRRHYTQTTRSERNTLDRFRQLWTISGHLLTFKQAAPHVLGRFLETALTTPPKCLTWSKDFLANSKILVQATVAYGKRDIVCELYALAEHMLFLSISNYGIFSQSHLKAFKNEPSYAGNPNMQVLEYWNLKKMHIFHSRRIRASSGQEWLAKLSTSRHW